MTLEASELTQERLRSILKMSNTAYEIPSPARMSKEALVKALAQRCEIRGNQLRNRLNWSAWMDDVPKRRTPVKNLPAYAYTLNEQVKTTLEKLPIAKLIEIAVDYNANFVIQRHIEKLSKDDMAELVEENYTFRLNNRDVGRYERQSAYDVEWANTDWFNTLEGIAPAQVRRSKKQKEEEARKQRNEARQTTALEQLRRVAAETATRNVERKEAARRALPETLGSPLEGLVVRRLPKPDHEGVRELVREAQNLRAVQVGEEGEDKRAIDAGEEVDVETQQDRDRKKYADMYKTYDTKPESMSQETYETTIVRNLRPLAELLEELGFTTMPKLGDGGIRLSDIGGYTINMKGRVYRTTSTKSASLFGKYNPILNSIKPAIKAPPKVVEAPKPKEAEFDPNARPKLTRTPANVKKVNAYYKSQSKTAAYFGVVQSTISRDLSKA
jgi:hypothetical protein